MFLYVECSQGALALCHVCGFSSPHAANHIQMLSALMITGHLGGPVMIAVQLWKSDSEWS